MQALTLTGIIDPDGCRRLNVPTQIAPGRVEVVLVFSLSLKLGLGRNTIFQIWLGP
ncbi:hypothetical protein [Candidatus Cyanaurora vandensis]|uniref:hypothetical protein n=1 Tax=Candidatus Cyanaurora vandensis TaxID=2714958 RepID=UPI00257A5C37|nr:hypothetical protein [Candidatus Cyanaurora vandensis]